MKKLLYLVAFAIIASSAFVACDKDDDSSPIRRVKLGAQENTVIGGFYSINDNNVYTMAEAAQKQDKIDLLCFYEHVEPNRINNISLASPGANITGIFTGDNSPENWTVTDTTFFYQVDPLVLSVAQFDLLQESDALIQTLYNEADAKRKAKDLKVGDIYAFNTEDNYFGLFKVVAVTQEATGSVEIEYIIKK